MTVTLEAKGSGTQLRLVHDLLPDGDTYDGHEAGWSRILDLATKDLEATT